jgi:hypothetical protein
LSLRRSHLIAALAALAVAFIAAFAIGKATAGTDESPSHAKSADVFSGSAYMLRLESVGNVPALRGAPESTTTSASGGSTDSSSSSGSISSPAPSPTPAPTPTPSPTPAPNGGGFGGEG